MRISVIYGAAAAFAVAAHEVYGGTSDSMCVVQIDDTGKLYEAPCEFIPLHKKENESGGIGQAAEAEAEVKVKRQVVPENSMIAIIATATAEIASATDGKVLSTLSGTYTTISELDVTATLPADLLTTAFATHTRGDGTKETLRNVQPAELTVPAGDNMEFLYGCGAAPNAFIICPFEGPTPPAAMFPGYFPEATSTPATRTILNIQRDTHDAAPTTPEDSTAASVLESMVAATDLWPTGVRPFMTPTPSVPAASDCVDSLAEEFAMITRHASHKPADSNMRIAISNFGINLVNGTLIDTMSRLGNIVANRQFQFDAYGQAGSIYTAGFQACGPPNARLLALGGSTVWWGCVSGTFMNLYDQKIAPQCVELTLPLLNNLEPGADLNAVADPTSAAPHKLVSMPTIFSQDDLASAHDKRLEPSDGMGKDLPAPFRDVPTVLTVTFATEPIVVAVATGDDDALEQITVQPATVPLTISADSRSSTGILQEKRQEGVTTSVVSSTTTPVFLFTPATTTSISVPVTSVVSQPVATTVVFTTVTLLRASSSALQNATSSSATSAIVAAPPSTALVTTVTEIQNATTILTKTHSTEVVTLPLSSTSFVTAGGDTATGTLANATTNVIVTSYTTAPQGSPNGTTLSTTARSFLNISEFTATGLTLTHPPSTLLSTSTTSDTPMTTESVMSGSIGGGMPASSITKDVGSDAHKTHLKRGMVPICSSIFVGLVIVWYADKYFGRLHV